MSPDRFRPFVSSTTFGSSSRSKRARLTLLVSFVLGPGASGIMSGAFGAHALKGRLGDQAATWVRKSRNPVIVSDRHSSLSFWNDREWRVNTQSSTEVSAIVDPTPGSRIPDQLSLAVASCPPRNLATPRPLETSRRSSHHCRHDSLLGIDFRAPPLQGQDGQFDKGCRTFNTRRRSPHDLWLPQSRELDSLSFLGLASERQRFVTPAHSLSSREQLL